MSIMDASTSKDRLVERQLHAEGRWHSIRPSGNSAAKSNGLIFRSWSVDDLGSGALASLDHLQFLPLVESATDSWSVLRIWL